MWTMLSGANLGSEYWPYIIQYAVYLRNRLPHKVLPIHIILLEQSTQKKPDPSHLRVFGSHGIVKEPKERRNKLANNHTSTGIFLTITEATIDIEYEDSLTNEVKTAYRIIFDEAYFGV